MNTELATQRSRRRRRRGVLLLAVVVAAATVLLSGACRTAPMPPSLGPSAPALTATVDRAAEAGDDAVDRFLALFADFQAPTIEAAALRVYAADAHFNDGFVVLEGNQAIAAYLARSADHVSELVVERQDVARHGPELYLRWEMRYTVEGDTIVAPGITHLRFDGDGRVIYHRDYWDASGALAAFVPPVAVILAKVRNRI